MFDVWRNLPPGVRERDVSKESEEDTRRREDDEAEKADHENDIEREDGAE